MFSPQLAESAFILCGGYLIFALALCGTGSRLFAWTNRTDISYGVYLYAWPIQTFMVWSLPGVSPWTICATTIMLASLLGYASWTLIEKPALALSHTCSERLWRGRVRQVAA